MVIFVCWIKKLKLYRHILWFKRSIYVEIILITYHKMRLLGTKGYNRVFPMFFLSTLGRARGNNMKYPNTLWGMAETSFGYPSKGYPKSSWNFILLTRWDGALYKQVARDLEPETRRSNPVKGQGGREGSHKLGWDWWGGAPHMVGATFTQLSLLGITIIFNLYMYIWIIEWA